MIHPDCELRPAAREIGLGVFATAPMPRGTIVWVLDELDQRVSPTRASRLGRRYRALLERYGYLNAAGERVVCWDLARWVNHSCDANVLSSGWEFDVAVRDIEPGDEITNDYGLLNLEESFTCRCRADSCRGTVQPSDFEALADGCDARVREAFPLLTQLPQPLWAWLPSKRLVTGAVRNPERLPSVRRHRLAPALEAPLRSAAARRA